jgi:hypothetical protein
VKEKDGKNKRRIIIDLKKSGANAKSKTPQRIVLPRPCDVVLMAVECKAEEDDLWEYAARNVAGKQKTGTLDWCALTSQTPSCTSA